MKLIGKIVKPQGVKGELKVYPADSNTSIYKNIKQIYIDNNLVDIKKLVLRQGFLYLTLFNVTDRNQAEAYRNKKIYADETQISLSQDTYYTEDMIGLDVVDENNNFIGTILDIDSFGSADVITILEENREYTIPFLTSIVTSVQADKIVVNKKNYDGAKICE